MSEETAESTAATTDVDATEDVLAGTDLVEDAASEETVQQIAEEPRIPKARFDEVVGEKNELKAEVGRLRGQMEEVLAAQLRQATTEKEGDTTDIYDLPAPPENMTQEQAVEWHVVHNARKNLKQILGFDPSEIQSMKKDMEILNQTGQSMAAMRAEQELEKRGLDINVPEQREVLGALLKSGKTDAEILDTMSRVFGSSGNGKIETVSTARVETGGVGSGAVSKPVYAFSAKEASALAAKGKKAERGSLEEIFARGDARRKPRGR